MASAFKILRSLKQDCRGATAVEYCLLVAIFGIALLVGIGGMGSGVADNLNTVSSTLSAAAH